MIWKLKQLDPKATPDGDICRFTVVKNRAIFLIKYIVIGSAIIIVLLRLGWSFRNIPLSTGDSICITQSTLVRPLFLKSSCEIVYRTTHGEGTSLSLLRDSDNEPAMVIPSADGRTFLCLYCADIFYRLIKVDPRKPPSMFTGSSYLNFIVRSTSCHVESGTIDDWEDLSKYLKSVSNDVFDQESLGFTRAVLISGVDLQIVNMQQGFKDRKSVV